MKAALLTKQTAVERRPLELADTEVPTPGPGEVLVRVHCCGVCRTDLHIVEGDLPLRKTPLIPGHQVAGSVDRLGEGCKRFRAGQRVGVAWLHRACETCEYCLSQHENLCAVAQFTGWTVNGGYSQYVAVPEDFVFPLPEGPEDEKIAPLLCAGVIGYRALRLSGIQPRQRLGLYGFGASAHIAIQVARYWECEVQVFTRSEANRRLALSLGAAAAGPAQDAAPRSLHAAVIFAPSGELVPLALTALRPGGTVAIAGIHLSPVPALDYAEHLYHERAVRSVANATRRDARELLGLATAIPIKTYVQIFPLEQANEALLALKTGRLTGAAVLTCRA